MQVKPKVGILTTFGGSDSAYSLVNVVATQLQMLVDNDYFPALFVCPSFTGTGIWADNRVEIRKTVNGDDTADNITACLEKMVTDIDIMLCHDIVFLMPQHKEWAEAVRTLAKKFPNIRWIHWQHSRGDHAPIDPVENSEFCYPNKGDLEHVRTINSTTADRVHYVPHPMDLNYLGWPKLAIQIAEDFNFPFVDVSMIYPSRLDRQKQVDKAVRVFSGFKKAGKSVCLLVADAYATGERFKEYKKDCLDLAAELGLNEKEFAFLGEMYEECVIGTPRPVVKALFEMSNIFLQVSNSETSSLVVMEAALAGNLIVLNTDFPPIHHLYKKALALPFSSVINPDTKYWRTFRTADGEETKVEDPQLFFDDRTRNDIIPILDSQIVSSVKRQQLRERWPSRVFKEYVEPLLLKGWNPEVSIPKCKGDPEVTAIITSLDNLPMLKRQLSVMIEEVGKIIVVNNGSIDGTKEWLEDNPITGMTVINLKNNGAGPGRNAGLAEWDKDKTPYTLMIDGGILPPLKGVRAMKDYLIRHPDTHVISPEISSCYTTEEDKATLIYPNDTIEDQHCFFQRMLSGTAYCLCRADAWVVRFCEDGPYGEPGWGVDDNDMQFRWNEAGIMHADFVSNAGMILFRRASGSFQRLFDETGVWPNQYGSVYEKRLVKLYHDFPGSLSSFPKVSCVVLGWNEYPMICKVIKGIHDDLLDIPHEIIVVNNGSTDETKDWMDVHQYRQHHGDTYIDKDGSIVRRTAENEEFWTGNFIGVHLPDNVGTGHGFNIGIDKARGEFIFFVCGDCLITKNSIRKLYEFLEANPDIGYAGVNAWMSEPDFTKELPPFEDLGTPQGLGNYAYSYAMIRKEVRDAGVKFADEGPFEGPGAGFEDAEYANLMYSKGIQARMFNGLMYYHIRRDGTRSGIEDRTDGSYDERKKYLMTRWNDVGFNITHLFDPERHFRRIAMMNNLYEGNPGPAGFLAMALRKIGCWVDQYNSLDNPFQDSDKHPAVVEGYYDNFIFVDDGDLQHWGCPDWGHPSIYWAIDMYNPSCWPYSPPDYYVNKAPTFDRFCSISQSAVEYCLERGVNAFHLPHAANEDYHRFIPIDEKDSGYTRLPEDIPYSIQRHYDWVAVWSNYGDRETYSKAAQEKFPGGLLAAGLWGDDYPKTVSQGKCALSMARGFEYPARVVETMMIGTPLVSKRDRFIDMFFVENEHFRGFSNPEEMLEQIQWVQDHPEESMEMADKARKLVLSQHRYYHRALRIFGG